jgi:hypothetical protein
MAKRKDVTIEVPTATMELKALPPKVITVKNFWRWNWKYLVITGLLIEVIAVTGCFLPWPLNLIFSIVLPVVPFFLGILAVANHTIKEITS